MTFSAWPTIPALCALLLVAADYSGRLSSSTPRTPKWPTSCWITGLIGTYGVQLVVIDYAATHRYGAPAWQLTMMPLPVVDMPGTDFIHANSIELIMLILAASQSYALLALYRLSPSRTAVAIGCGLMLFASVSAPGLLSADLYGYVHDSILGFATYNPPKIPFPGQFHVFDLLYGVGAKTLYGPLWLAVIPLVTFAAPTLLAKMLSLRLFSLALFLLLLLGLRALRLPARLRNVAALNPALMLQFVSNGHNDLIPLDLLLWAAVWMRAQPALAFGMMAAAGLVKLPYVLLGLPIVAVLRPRWAGIAGSIVTLVVVAVVSWIVGRTGYTGWLAGHVSQFPPNATHELAAVAAVLLMVAAALGRRRLRAAVLVAPMFSAAIYSWYFIWGFPYALARRRILGFLLVGFPFVTTLVGSVFQRVWVVNILLPGIVMIWLLASNKRPTQTRKHAQGVAASPLATPE